MNIGRCGLCAAVFIPSPESFTFCSKCRADMNARVAECDADNARAALQSEIKKQKRVTT